MPEIYLPTLHTFAMDNVFTGSCGMFRFKAEPNIIKKSPKEVDMENSTITAKYWHGPFCFEKSEIEGEETFPMTDQGREDLIAWLQSHI